MNENYFDVEFRYSREEFTELDGFEDYLVSNMGRVITKPKLINQRNNSKKIRASKVLKPRLNKKGYGSVVLYKDNKQHSFRLHRLIYLAFVGDIPNKMQINHLNADKMDNRLENLELVTHQENMDHAKKLGLIKGIRGEENHASKFTKFQIRLIRESFKRGHQTKTELANYYDVSYSTIDRIVKYQTWKHIK